MVTRLMIVDDPDDDDRDESGVERHERAEYIKGAERRRLILDLARGVRKIVDLAEEYDRPAQTISNFKYRNKREIREMSLALTEKTKDLFFYAQHMRLHQAEQHLLILDDQIREMLEAAQREENPVAIDLKELRGLTAEANKIRKELREELKPSISLGEITFTPPKSYGPEDKGWFGEEQ